MSRLKLSTALVFVALILGCQESGPKPDPDPEPVMTWRNVDVRGQSIPAVDDVAVYNLEQETHVLSAVRKSDGKLLWKRVLPVSRPNFDGYGLGVSGGILVVGDLDLFGIDPATGNIVWRYQQSEGRNPGFARFALVGGTVFCGSTSGHIFAVDAATGTEQWVSRAVPDTASIYYPQVVGGAIYAGFTRFADQTVRGGAVALSAATGQVIWSTFAPVPPSNPTTENTDGVVIAGDKAFFGSTTGIHVVERTTGAGIVTIGPSALGDHALNPRSVFLVGGVVLVASGSPALVTALDPITLQRKWQVGTTISVSDISGDGDIAYIPQVGSLVAINVQTGVTKWTFKSSSVGVPNEVFLAAPTPNEGMVYLPGSVAVYALKRD